MIIEHAPPPVPVQGVTTLMSVGDVSFTTSPVVKGAALGFLAAVLLGSKRKLTFTAAGALVAWWRSR